MLPSREVRCAIGTKDGLTVMRGPLRLRKKQQLLLQVQRTLTGYRNTIPGERHVTILNSHAMPGILRRPTRSLQFPLPRPAALTQYVSLNLLRHWLMKHHAFLASQFQLLLTQCSAKIFEYFSVYGTALTMVSVRHQHVTVKGEEVASFSLAAERRQGLWSPPPNLTEPQATCCRAFCAGTQDLSAGLQEPPKIILLGDGTLRLSAGMCRVSPTRRHHPSVHFRGCATLFKQHTSRC